MSRDSLEVRAVVQAMLIIALSWPSCGSPATAMKPRPTTTELVSIALLDKNHLKRRDAAKAITDEQAAFVVARDAEDSIVRSIASANVHTGELLAELARTTADNSLCLNAAGRIRDQQILADFIRHEWSGWTAALGNLTDQGLLMQLLDAEASEGMRSILVTKLTDQAVLTNLVLESQSSRVRQAAVKNLTDQSLLAKLAQTDGDSRVRGAAVERLDNQEILAAIAIRDDEQAVRHSALARVSSSELLVAVASQNDNSHVGEKALSRLAQPDLIARVALEAIETVGRRWSNYGELNSVGATAVGRVVDVATLRNIADAASSVAARRAALARLDLADVADLSTHGRDVATRLAARVRMGEETWERVLQEASQNYANSGVVLRDASIGAVETVLKALALSPPTSELPPLLLKLCHDYIEKGETAGIPNLLSILDQHGDRAMAEDFLNCGHGQLNAAAVGWAARHGYSVSRGPGSHRVDWGSKSR